MKFSHPRGLVFAVLVVVISLAVYLFSLSPVKNLLNQNSETDTIPTERLLTKVPETADPIFEKVQQFIEEKTQPDNILISENSYVWWLSDDDYNTINNGPVGITAQYGCGNSSTSRYDPSLTTLAHLFPEFMRQQGFMKNSNNTSASLTDDKFYDYVQAYEKDDLKCTLTANPDCSSTDSNNFWQTITFSCTSDYPANLAVQSKILKDLKIKNAVVYITKQVGSFAKIQVHYRRTGRYVIAEYKDGAWKQIFGGQDDPSCSVMHQYNVPPEIYGNCYDY